MLNTYQMPDANPFKNAYETLPMDRQIDLWMDA